jgi:hypothetical protein
MIARCPNARPWDLVCVACISVPPWFLPLHAVDGTTMAGTADTALTAR